jgi:hypothetical protein
MHGHCHLKTDLQPLLFRENYAFSKPLFVLPSLVISRFKIQGWKRISAWLGPDEISMGGDTYITERIAFSNF